MAGHRWSVTETKGLSPAWKVRPKCECTENVIKYRRWERKALKAVEGCLKALLTPGKCLQLLRKNSTFLVFVALIF